MEYFVTVIACVLLMGPTVMGYSSGPPTNVCGSMTPLHSTPQTTPSPYEIFVNQTSYNPGDVIQVMITGPTFRGFMLQARTSNGDHVGTFGTTTNTQTITCNGNAAAGHSTKLAVTSIMLPWTAPLLNENIVFIATVVQTFSTFWVLIPGPEIFSLPLCPPMPNGYLIEELSEESVEVSWTAPEMQKIEFTVRGVVGHDGHTPGNSYISIGFSKDDKMGNDSVVDCIQTGAMGMVGVQASYNSGYSNSVDMPGNSGLSLTTGSRTGNVLECVFKRDVSMDGNAEFFDLSSMNYTLLVAHGEVDAGDVKMMHGIMKSERPVKSVDTIDFMAPGTYKTFV